MASVQSPFPNLARFLTAGLLAFGLGAGAPVAEAIEGEAMLLVASSSMSDPRFAKSVVLVTRHGRSPPIGVILNRPLEVPLAKIFPELPNDAGKRILHFGGPVAPDNLVFLFRNAVGSADAIALSAGLHLGRAGPTLKNLLRGQSPHTGLRVFAGHAAWGFGQLEREIRQGAWHVLPLDPDYVFDKDIDLIWPELYRRATETTAKLLLPQLSLPHLLT